MAEKLKNETVRNLISISRDLGTLVASTKLLSSEYVPDEALRPLANDVLENVNHLRGLMTRFFEDFDMSVSEESDDEDFAGELDLGVVESILSEYAAGDNVDAEEEIVTEDEDVMEEELKETVDAEYEADSTELAVVEAGDVAVVDGEEVEEVEEEGETLESVIDIAALEAAVDADDDAFIPEDSLETLDAAIDGVVVDDNLDAQLKAIVDEEAGTVAEPIDVTPNSRDGEYREDDFAN